jgi:hypothetical protein
MPAFPRSAILFASFISRSTASTMRKWTSTDCLPASTPTGYNLADTSSVFVSNDFYTQIQNACNPSGSSYNKGTCSSLLTQGEDALFNLFATSDADLAAIYKQMFGCPQYNGVPLATAITNAYTTLLQLNGTVFGSGQDPGILNDLYTLLDGIDQIKAVASGQVLSVGSAASSQIVAAQSLQGKMTDTANAILSQTMDLMNSLVGNRTNAQNEVFAYIGQTVDQAVQDIQNQANALSSQITAQSGQLTDRYNAWNSQAQTAIADVTARSRDLQAAQQQADAAGQQMVRNLQSSELAGVTDQVNNAKSQFTADLGNAQNSISTDITNLGNDLSNAVSANAGQFISQTNALSQSIANTESFLRGKINTAASVNAQSAADAVARADAAAGKLKALLGTTIQPLVADVQSTMQKIITLSAAIDAAKTATNNDLTNIKGPMLQSASGLANQIQSTFSSKQSDFTDKFEVIQSSMQQQVSAKVSTGRSQLSQILGQVQSSQNSAASQQTLEGQTAQDQASASKTAADLVNAKQKAAADTTQAGLDTAIGAVGSALQDSQETIAAISDQNKANLMAVNKQIGSSQQATYQEAYSQVQAGSDAANAQSAAVRTDSFNAQISGQDLEQSIEESGTQLQSSVAYQNRQAQSLLGDIQDILNLAKQNSGTLEDQMTAFEQQAPDLYTILEHKIGGYEALLISQGQQAQTVAANSAAASAQSALSKLADSLQIYSTSGGVSPSLAADQSKVGSDSTSLLQDIKTLNNQLAQQSNNGAIYVSNTAQAAATQAASQIKSMSKDSAAALAALVQYNSDLINQKRVDVLNSGDAALQAAMDAASFMQSNAQRFVDLSNQFVSDATKLGGQASQNLSSMVNGINQTLADLTASSDLYLSRISDAAGTISSWPSQIVTQASNINAQIQAKAADVTNAIMAVADSSSAGKSDIQDNIRKLQSFVNDLIDTFNKQRASFNEFAHTYSERRIELLAGLNDTIASQKTNFLSGLTGTDMAEAQKSGSTTDTIQNLLTSLENAKTQGVTDKDQVAAIMGKISDGVGGLTDSFASKMGVDLNALKQKAAKDAIMGQQGIHGSVSNTGVSANLLAGQLADAIDKIGGNQFLADISAQGANKDVYAIAGLLKNTGAETQNKIASLLRSLQSGSMTFADALNAAKTMTQKDVNTVLDILNVFNQYVTQHLGAVYQFNATVIDSVNAVNTTATNAIAEHVKINAAALASMTANQYKLSALATALMPDPNTATGGIIQNVQASRNQSIEDLENYMNTVLHGGPPGGVAKAVAQIQIRETSPDKASLVEKGASLIAIRRKMPVAEDPVMALEAAAEDPAMAWEAAAEDPAIAKKLDPRDMAMAKRLDLRDKGMAKELKEPAAEKMVPKQIMVAAASIPDVLTQVNNDLVTAKTQVTAAKSTLDDTVTRSLAAANSAISDILKITQTALQAS